MSARRTRIACALAIALSFVVGSAAVAVAYWSGTGTGSISERVDNSHALVLVPGVAMPDLYPGGSGSVTVRVDNPNPVQVLVPKLQLDTSQVAPVEVDAAARAAGCDSGSLVFGEQDNGGAGWFIPPQIGSVDGTRTIQLENALSMSIDAADACQSARFVVHLAVGT